MANGNGGGVSGTGCTEQIEGIGEGIGGSHGEVYKFTMEVGSYEELYKFITGAGGSSCRKLYKFIMEVVLPLRLSHSRVPPS